MALQKKQSHIFLQFFLNKISLLLYILVLALLTFEYFKFQF